MNYKVEGYIGEFEIPLCPKTGKVVFKLVPHGEYAHESSTSGKTMRNILLIGGSGSALLLDENVEFSIQTGCPQVLAASIVAMKTSKAKVCITCNKARKVLSLRAV